jgi:hypothetical protein
MGIGLAKRPGFAGFSPRRFSRPNFPRGILTHRPILVQGGLRYEA